MASRQDIRESRDFWEDERDNEIISAGISVTSTAGGLALMGFGVWRALRGDPYAFIAVSTGAVLAGAMGYQAVDELADISGLQAHVPERQAQLDAPEPGS